MNSKRNYIPRMVTVVTTVLLLATGITPASGLGAVKCDTAKGFGDENVQCPLTCEHNDTVSGTIQQFNGDDVRRMYVEVNCGSADDSNLCYDRDACDAQDDNGANEQDIGHCKGWADEEWNDYYTIELWCSSSGGDSTASLEQALQAIQEGSNVMVACASMAKVINEEDLRVTSVVFATATFIDGEWITDGFTFNGLCQSSTPQATSFQGGLLLEA